MCIRKQNCKAVKSLLESLPVTRFHGIFLHINSNFTGIEIRYEIRPVWSVEELPLLKHHNPNHRLVEIPHTSTRSPPPSNLTLWHSEPVVPPWQIQWHKWDRPIGWTNQRLHLRFFRWIGKGTRHWGSPCPSTGWIRRIGIDTSWCWARSKKIEVGDPLDLKMHEDQELQNGFPLSLCYIVLYDVDGCHVSGPSTPRKNAKPEGLMLHFNAFHMFSCYPDSIYWSQFQIYSSKPVDFPVAVLLVNLLHLPLVSPTCPRNLL